MALYEIDHNLANVQVGGHTIVRCSDIVEVKTRIDKRR
jgi:hypothetical protein